MGDLLATTLAEGSVSFLYYADRVNQLPLGVIGVAVGIALLPLLTRQLRSGHPEEAMNSMNRAIELCLVLTMPAAVALIAIPFPIITVLFERGAFDRTAAEATAAALQAFAIGLPAYVLIKALLPGFFAREDTKTPVQVAAFAMVGNIAIALVLMQFFDHVGIAMASAVSAWFNVITLAIILQRRGHLVFDARLKKVLPRLILSVALFGVALFAAGLWSTPLLDEGGLVKLGVLVALVLGGGMFFLILASLFGAADFREALGQLKRSKSREQPS